MRPYLDRLLYGDPVKLLNAKLLEVRTAIEVIRIGPLRRFHLPEGPLTHFPQDPFSGHLLDMIAHSRWSGRCTEDRQEVRHQTGDVGGGH